MIEKNFQLCKIGSIYATCLQVGKQNYYNTERRPKMCSIQKFSGVLQHKFDLKLASVSHNKTKILFFPNLKGFFLLRELLL
jgi:hypothetical protein